MSTNFLTPTLSSGYPRMMQTGQHYYAYSYSTHTGRYLEFTRE